MHRLRIAAVLGLALVAFLVTTPGSQSATTLIRIAHNLPEKTSVGVYYKTLATEIEKATAGTAQPLKVQLFPNGQLFNDTQMPDAISRGLIQIGGVQVDFVNQPEARPLRIGELPFAFNGWKALWAAEDDPAFRDLFEQQMAKMGMHHLGWVPYGTVEFYANTRIEKPDDLKRKRLRSFGVITSKLIQALGASPVSLSSQELYQAMQRGTIDGFITGPTSVASRKLDEVVKFGTKADVMFLDHLAEANKDWWSKLPADTRAAVVKAERTASDEARENVRKEVMDAERKIAAAGVELIEPSASVRQAWVEAVSPVVADYRADGGEVAVKLLAIADKANQGELGK